MQNFIFTRALVFGAIAQLLFPRHSFPTIELAAPAVPWQLLLWVSAPHCPPIVPTPAKSTRTKCSPGFGQENLIVHDISSTDSAHTVDALSFCCIALHTPGGAGGDGGEGGDGDGGDGGGDGALDLSGVEYFVMDEADKMLTGGLLEQAGPRRTPRRSSLRTISLRTLSLCTLSPHPLSALSFCTLSLHLPSAPCLLRWSS